MSSLSNMLLPVVLMLLFGPMARRLRPAPLRARVLVPYPAQRRRRRTG